MIDFAMASELEHVPSDSASLGSNPSPPAIEIQRNSRVTRGGHTGQVGTEGARVPHRYRHSLRQLQRVFDRRPSDWGARNWAEAYECLIEAREDHRLSIKPVTVSRAVLRAADRGRAQRSARRSESLEHCWLKQVGKAWMLEQFGVTAQYEFSECGGSYDLGSSEARVVLECGNTNAWNCVLLLRNYPDWRYFQIPYQFGATLWFDEEPNAPHVFLFEVSGNP